MNGTIMDQDIECREIFFACQFPRDVCFCTASQDKAFELALSGAIERNGSEYKVLIEGIKKQIVTFIRWLIEHGLEFKIEKLIVRKVSFHYFIGFDIIHACKVDLEI